MAMSVKYGRVVFEEHDAMTNASKDAQRKGFTFILKDTIIYGFLIRTEFGLRYYLNLLNFFATAKILLISQAAKYEARIIPLSSQRQQKRDLIWPCGINLLILQTEINHELR